MNADNLAAPTPLSAGRRSKRAPHETLAVEAATLRCILTVLESHNIEGCGAELESAEAALRCSIERLEELCSPVNDLHTLVEKMREVAHA